MRLLKQAMAVLGTALTIAVLVAIVAPKTAHAVAAALVQIVPGTTTHLGQNESQLVQLVCNPTKEYCLAFNTDATETESPYVVPSGYTLIVTDWEFVGIVTAGGSTLDSLRVTGPNFPVFLVYAVGMADPNGGVYFHEKYTTGIRIGSGLTISDSLARQSTGDGFATIQGYLVPNT